MSSIHTIVMRCEGKTYDPWQIGADTVSVEGFYRVVEEDLRDDFGGNDAIEIVAKVRGGELTIKVDSDEALMMMFNWNTDHAVPIVIEVERLVITPIAVLFPDPSPQAQGHGDQVDVGNEDDVDIEVDNSDEYESVEEVDEDSNSSDVDFREIDEIRESVVHNSEDEVIEQPRQQFQRRRDNSDYEANPNSNFPEGPPHIDPHGKIVLALWQVFDDHKHFWRVLKDYCVQEGFKILKKKYERKRVTVTCKAEPCPWRCHASLSPDASYLIIKTMKSEHTCQQVRKRRHSPPNTDKPIRQPQSSVKRCKQCKQLGHNQRSCQQSPMSRLPRRSSNPSGRSRVHPQKNTSAAVEPSPVEGPTPNVVATQIMDSVEEMNLSQPNLSTQQSEMT